MEAGRESNSTDVRVDLLRFARHGLEQRVRAERIKVRPCKMKRTLARDAPEIERGIETELARERLEDAQLRLVRVAHSEVEQPVEPSGSEQRGVEQVRPVRRADDEDVSGAGAGGGGRGDAVEFG